jgi:hypothetical protein
LKEGKPPRKGRVSIKRKQGNEAPSLKTEVMLLEDIGYIFKKWPAVKDECQAQQRERLCRTSGCIDTRWEYTAGTFFFCMHS